jgi:putative chitinase
MAIQESVGKQGINNKVDVKVIQAALNLVQSPNFKLKNRLVIDGKNGSKTITSIEAFQKDIVKLSNPDGRIDVNGKTLKTLKKNISAGLINQDSLSAIMAMGHKSTLKLYLNLLKTTLPKYQVNTPLRIAHFLAQIGHESMSFIYTEEIATGAAYEGRKDLGNIKKGDGVRFKGRGLLQLTGRDNYEHYGKYIKKDLLKLGNEQIVATTPKYALDVSLWFWNNRKLNKYADNDNLRAITRRVNGGYNGLLDRELYLKRAKFFLLP